MNALAAIGEDAVVIDTQPQTEPATDAALIERSWRMPDVFAAVFDRYYVEIHGFVASPPRSRTARTSGNAPEQVGGVGSRGPCASGR